MATNHGCAALTEPVVSMDPDTQRCLVSTLDALDDLLTALVGMRPGDPSFWESPTDIEWLRPLVALWAELRQIASAGVLHVGAGRAVKALVDLIVLATDPGFARQYAPLRESRSDAVKHHIRVVSRCIRLEHVLVRAAHRAGIESEPAPEGAASHRKIRASDA